MLNSPRIMSTQDCCPRACSAPRRRTQHQAPCAERMSPGEAKPSDYLERLKLFSHLFTSSPTPHCRCHPASVVDAAASQYANAMVNHVPDRSNRRFVPNQGTQGSILPLFSAADTCITRSAKVVQLPRAIHITASLILHPMRILPRPFNVQVELKPHHFTHQSFICRRLRNTQIFRCNQRKGLE